MIAQSPVNQSIRLALPAGLGYLQGKRHQLSTGNAAMASFTITRGRCGTHSRIIRAIERAAEDV